MPREHNTMTQLGMHIQTQKGYAFKSKWYSDQGTPIVKVSDFTDESINASNLTHIPGEIAADYSRFVLKTGDIVIQTVGSWPTNPSSVVGKVIRVPSSASGALLNQNAVRIDPDETLDKAFLFYLLKDDAFKNYIIGDARGAASQASVTLDAIRMFAFELSPLPTQRKIAAILSAYDDLIENNTRRIAVLEEMARTLYREWFVHFRFPGHEQIAMVDSELGVIPEGWTAKSLGEVCYLVIGQSPKSEFYNESGAGLPFHQGVKDFGDLYPTTRVYCTVTKRVAEAGDILFSVRAPVGRMNITDRKIVIGRGLHAIRSQTGNQTYIFLQLKDKFHEEDMMGGGTIFKSVTKADVLDIQLLMPPDNLLAKFEQIATPMLSETKILTEKNANLRQTRDLLLPRLISGQLDVSELEILAGELGQ